MCILNRSEQLAPPLANRKKTDGGGGGGGGGGECGRVGGCGLVYWPSRCLACTECRIRPAILTIASSLGWLCGRYFTSLRFVRLLPWPSHGHPRTSRRVRAHTNDSLLRAQVLVAAVVVVMLFTFLISISPFICVRVGEVVSPRAIRGAVTTLV